MHYVFSPSEQLYPQTSSAGTSGGEWRLPLCTTGNFKTEQATYWMIWDWSACSHHRFMQSQMIYI